MACGIVSARPTPAKRAHKNHRCRQNTSIGISELYETEMGAMATVLRKAVGRAPMSLRFLTINKRKPARKKNPRRVGGAGWGGQWGGLPKGSRAWVGRLGVGTG